MLGDLLSPLSSSTHGLFILLLVNVLELDLGRRPGPEVQVVGVATRLHQIVDLLVLCSGWGGCCCWWWVVKSDKEGEKERKQSLETTQFGTVSERNLNC